MEAPDEAQGHGRVTEPALDDSEDAEYWEARDRRRAREEEAAEDWADDGGWE